MSTYQSNMEHPTPCGNDRGRSNYEGMSHRRNDRWEPPEPFTLPAEARGGPERTMTPPTDVRAWVLLGNRLVRVEGRALSATDDAVLVEWGERTTRQSAWVWRSAVKRKAVYKR